LLNPLDIILIEILSIDICGRLIVVPYCHQTTSNLLHPDVVIQDLSQPAEGIDAYQVIESHHVFIRGGARFFLALMRVERAKIGGSRHLLRSRIYDE
jgi:hypothetical protein